MHYFKSLTFIVFLLSQFLTVTVFAAEERSLSVRKKTISTERRVALIIGNSSYSDAPLKNPVNDADAMARVLRETGFEVTVVKNADRRKMFSSMSEFGRKLRKSDVGLFYYAGHGVQIDNANYLLPVDLKGSDIQETDDLRHNSFPLNEPLDRMRDATTNNIIILDACRDNPFLTRISRSASRGLAKVSTPASTSILYSTDPGNTASDGLSGDNGVFTKRLVESIQKSGLELVEVMREVALNVTRDTNGAQRPVFDGVLSSKFYFREPEEVKPPPVEPPPSAITVDRQLMELRYWESVEKSGTSAAYQSYLKKFPSGDFSELAKDRLEQIAVQKANDNTKTERDRLAKEKSDLERTAKEAAERTRLAEERADLERRMLDAEAKARQAEERSKQSAADQARLAKEKADLERTAKEAAKQERLAKEKSDLERTAKEAAERTRLAEERADLERRMRDAEAKARQAEERSKQSAADQARLAKEKADLERTAKEAAKQERLAKEKSDLERVNAQLATKPQVVASLPPDKVAKKELIKEKIDNFLVSDLTVTDEISGLVWVRDANLTGLKSYSNAQSIINKFNQSNFAGYNDWRMPGDSDYYVFYKNLQTEAKKSKSTVLQIIDRLFLNYPYQEPWLFINDYSRMGYTGGTMGNTSATYDFIDGTIRMISKNEDALVLLVRGTIM